MDDLIQRAERVVPNGAIDASYVEIIKALLVEAKRWRLVRRKATQSADSERVYYKLSFLVGQLNYPNKAPSVDECADAAIAKLEADGVRL